MIFVLRRFVCWLLGHDHRYVRIMLTHHDGLPSYSQWMDRWSADWTLANVIAVDAAFAGRSVRSARIVSDPYDLTVR